MLLVQQPPPPRLAPIPTAAYDQILDGKKRMSAFKQAGWGEKDKECSIMHEPRLLLMSVGIRIPQSRSSGATEAHGEAPQSCRCLSDTIRQCWVDSEKTYMNQKARNRVIM